MEKDKITMVSKTWKKTNSPWCPRHGKRQIHHGVQDMEKDQITMVCDVGKQINS
jgi:hypothetical protein